MAINWSAYEAAKELYGDNKENIIDIGSRFPLFARTVMADNSDYLLDILKAIPKVTARVVENGLKEMEDSEPEMEEESKDEAPKKETVKKTKKKNEEEEAGGYEDMTAKELYKLCCERGISSKCKSRSKDALIKVLEAYDNGEFDSEKESKGKKSKADKPKTKKSEPEPSEDDEDDDWEDEEEEETDPYAGKSAKELYKMCCDRGIKTKQKLSADVYAKLLKKADEEATEEPEEDDEDDDWEI